MALPVPLGKFSKNSGYQCGCRVLRRPRSLRDSTAEEACNFDVEESGSNQPGAVQARLQVDPYFRDLTAKIEPQPLRSSGMRAEWTESSGNRYQERDGYSAVGNERRKIELVIVKPAHHRYGAHELGTKAHGIGESTTVRVKCVRECFSSKVRSIETWPRMGDTPRAISHRFHGPIAGPVGHGRAYHDNGDLVQRARVILKAVSSVLKRVAIRGPGKGHEPRRSSQPG